MKPAPPLEREEQAQVLRMLRAHGLLAWPINREVAWKKAGAVGVAGFADILAIADSRCLCLYPDATMGFRIGRGRAIFIELKRSKSRTKRITALRQRAFAEAVTAAGAVYIRVDEKDRRTACEQVRDALGLIQPREAATR